MALTVLESRLKTEFDRMALDHLFGIGAIKESRRRPKTAKAGKGSRIAWKRLNATNRLGCDQCGMGGADSGKGNPYSMKLCDGCRKVHHHSIFAGLKPSDEVRW